MKKNVNEGGIAMKQAIEVKVVEYERTRYGKVCTIARLFDMNRTTV